MVTKSHRSFSEAPVSSPNSNGSSSERNWREAVTDDRLAHLVKDLFRAMTRGLQIRLTDHLVSFGFWAIFRVLWERDNVTQRELSEFVGLSEPTIHTALASMERLGYITRKKMPDNQRKVYISLTPLGSALKKELIPLAEDLNTVATQGIPQKDLAIFRKTILAMQKNLDENEIELNRSVPPLRRMVPPLRKKK
jgi:DNA-binding MarR family transcriptional regulator